MHSVLLSGVKEENPIGMKYNLDLSPSFLYLDEDTLVVPVV